MYDLPQLQIADEDESPPKATAFPLYYFCIIGAIGEVPIRTNPRVHVLCAERPSALIPDARLTAPNSAE